MTLPWVLFVIALLGCLILAVALWNRCSRPLPQTASDPAELVHMVSTLRLNTDAVCLLDPTGHITWANPAYLKLTGYEIEELLGRSLSDLLHQSVEDRAATQAIDAALEEARELRIDMRFLPKTGDAYWVVIELHPIRDSRSRCLMGYAVVQINIDVQRRDRDLTRQALRDLQAVRDILDHHALVTETDLHGVITRVNQRFVEISGYSAAELLGQNHHVVSSGLHDANTWRSVWNTIRRGQIWHGEICNRRKDGSLYWVDSVIAPMLDRYGQPERYVSIRTDITSLKRNRDLLSRTGRVAGIGGWYCNLQTRVLYFTEAARRILCLDTDNMSADPTLHHLLPGGLSRALLDGVKQVIDTGRAFSREVEIGRPDGSLQWVYISCEKENQEEQSSTLVGAVQDITELVTARLHAQASERLLRSAIDALDEAFALYDQRERLVFCNDKYRALFDPEHTLDTVIGLSAEQALRLAAQNNTYPISSDNPEAWVQAQLRLWRQSSFQQRAQLNNGRWVKSMGMATPDGMLVMFRMDITDLQLALEAADAASLSKSQFLANMSHEIRTPMNAVLGMLQVLNQTSLTLEQQDLLRRTKGAASALLGILNDVLDVSKVEAGKMHLDPAPFAVDSLLTDLSTILHGALGKRTLAVIYDIDPDVPDVLIGDAQRLKQVLINLGGNAVKFTEQGYVRLKLRVLERQAGQVCLRFAIEDTGIGIAPDAIQNLFSAFSQAEYSTSRRYGGTGLGLTISQRLVALMGGTLQVESELGQGSCFFFDIFLPIGNTSQLPQSVTETASPQQRLQGMTLLLVEDNEINQMVAVRLLENEGAKVVVAGDGQQGLDALNQAEDRYDLVLMDIQMPVMDGLQATQAIRRQPQHADLPIIAMTANAMQSDHDTSIAADMNAHVGKPFELDELVHTILHLTGRLAEPKRIAPPPAAASATKEAESVLDTASALTRLDNDTLFYARLLRDFAPAARRLVQQMTDNAQCNAERVRAAAHQLKSTAAAVGAQELAALCASLENHSAPCAQAAPQPAEVQAVENALERTLAAQADWLSARQTLPAGDHRSQNADFSLALTRLADALRINDMQALELFDELMATHGEPQTPEWQALQTAMDAFDTEEALRALPDLPPPPARPSA